MSITAGQLVDFKAHLESGKLPKEALVAMGLPDEKPYRVLKQLNLSMTKAQSNRFRLEVMVPNHLLHRLNAQGANIQNKARWNAIRQKLNELVGV